MFKFLRDKLKSTISSFTKKVEDEAEEEVVEQDVEEEQVEEKSPHSKKEDTDKESEKKEDVAPTPDENPIDEPERDDDDDDEGDDGEEGGAEKGSDESKHADKDEDSEEEQPSEPEEKDVEEKQEEVKKEQDEKKPPRVKKEEKEEGKELKKGRKEEEPKERKKEEEKTPKKETKVEGDTVSVEESEVSDLKEEEKKESKGFFSRIKEAFVGTSEEKDDSEYVEVDDEKGDVVEEEVKETVPKKTTKQILEEKSQKVEKKKQSGEVPTVQELTELKQAKKAHEEKIAPKSAPVEEVHSLEEEDIIEKEIKEKEVELEEKRKEIATVREQIAEKKEGEETKEEEEGEETKEEERRESDGEKEGAAQEEEEKKQDVRSRESEKESNDNLQPEEEATGFFSRLKQRFVTKRLNEKQFEDMFWDLEIGLLENNVAVEVIDKIKEDLHEALVDKPIARSKVEKVIIKSLRDSVESLFDVDEIDVFSEITKKRPYVICFVGINGSGKTTTIAKMTQMFLDKGLSCVLVAADTFRAAAIDQLGLHADKLGVKMIKHDYGSDPAAVAHDGIAYAKSKDIDVVLIDTAGRMHSNDNLVEEMKKIIRVSDPDLKLFIGESVTGNDCTDQAKKFNEAIEIDGIVLSKADIDDKGGAAISVSYVTKKPILYLGVGQEYSDIKPFDSAEIVGSLGLEV